MSRRIYYTNPKRKQITQEAMLQLRQTRRAIDPALLEQAREIIARKAEKQDVYKEDRAGGDVEKVDRRKTLRTIMKFLELKPDNPALRSEIKAMFSEGLH